MLRLAGENEFKIRAYANAGRALAAFPGDLAAAVADGSLRSIPGIGPAILEKISTLVATGRLPYLEDLRARFPASLAALYRVPGLGPRKIDVLREKLGIASLADLEAACRDGTLAALPGFGPGEREEDPGRDRHRRPGRRGAALPGSRGPRRPPARPGRRGGSLRGGRDRGRRSERLRARRESRPRGLGRRFASRSGFLRIASRLGSRRAA